MVRWKLAPQAGALGSNLIVRKGISISIVHPISLLFTRANEIPSQARAAVSVPPPVESAALIRLSPIAPLGFISKKYPDRPSRYGSKLQLNRSPDVKTASRCIVLPRSLSGSESKHVTPM